MFKRGLAMSLVLGVASVVYADVEVRLVPTPSANPYNPPGMYDVGETDISVDVYLSQTPGAEDWLLRHVQFNLDGTDASLLAGVSMPVTHSPSAGDIRFWDFSSVAACAGDVEQCGAGHYIDDSNAAGPKGVAISYYSTVASPVIPDDTDENAAAQIVLPADGSCVHVGVVNVSIPAGGPYTLDLVNIAEVDPELAGRVSYGFGLAAGGINNMEPVTTHGTGASALTGGTLVLNHITQDVVASLPDDGETLPSTKGNVIKVSFGSSVAADAADAALHGMVTVHELLPCGGLGPNLANLGDVRFDIEDGGTTLRVSDISGAGLFDHQTWYAVVNDGTWGAATPFKVDLVTVYGDVDNSLFTDFGDIPALLASLDTAADDTNRRADIDGNGFIDFGDIPALLGTLDTGATSKPFGH